MTQYAIYASPHDGSKDILIACVSDTSPEMAVANPATQAVIRSRNIMAGYDFIAEPVAS